MNISLQRENNKWNLPNMLNNSKPTGGLKVIEILLLS
jgi:hypothetical protein